MVDRASAFERLEEPQRRGDASEAIVRSEFAARGVTVLRPEHDNAPYDLVVEVDGQFYRIQSKTAFAGQNDGAIRFEVRTTRVKSSGYEREGYVGKIDYFAVYSPETDEVYLVGIEEAPNTDMTIRTSAASNGNRTNVNWHEEYRLDARLPDLRSGAETRQAN